MIEKDCLGKVCQESYSLFSKKDDYLMTHTERGQNILFQQLPTHIKRKMKCDNLHLIGNMQFTPKYGMPILQTYNPIIPEIEWFSYTDRHKHGKSPWGIHFFLHDYKFLKAVTDNLEVTTRAICNCDYVISPDCSLYVDLPTPFYNIQNIYRSRFAAAYWQSCGINVIQSASWGDAASLSYCFEGLAENSITAVGGIGHDHCASARRLWEYAINKLIDEKNPTMLIVYGGNRGHMPDFGINTLYVNDFINTHFRNHA